MPSFAEDNDSPGPDMADSPPIQGTGLHIPSLHKRVRASGTNPAGSPPDGTSWKLPRAPSVAKKLTARPPHYSPSVMPSLSTPSSAKQDAATKEDLTKSEEDPQSGLFQQVYDWLQHEKARRKTRKARKSAELGVQEDAPADVDGPVEGSNPVPSESSFSLEKLEKILMQYGNSRYGAAFGPVQSVRRSYRRRAKGLRRGSASESDTTDLEAAVPHVDAVLDNSKTLAYTGGVAGEEDYAANEKSATDLEAWIAFKTEIVRLAHTLQLKGWRKVSMDSAVGIKVIRLSGALTNAVYVVHPPKHVPVQRSENGSAALVPRKPPPKLLLRVYGPQVDRLIDREKELQILRRLGRKNIGPRVLGTFINGRFEEYFEARPLTPRELRMPETAKQIAKRMRELHDGIELLEEEREGGPMIFKNWDKWVDRCEQVTTWLDKEIMSPHNEAKAALEPWRRRGFVCGVPWTVFRKAVDSYRIWLIASCGGIEEIKQQLVFAHNDTQYGNLLRLEPATESPLLLPANEHKQLVVIDFEYASANTPALEFANHFTEWCYNYHDEERSWACSNRMYPTSEEQYRFVSAYLTHRPGIPGSPFGTPSIRPRTATHITPLSLDEGPDGVSSQQLQAEYFTQDELDSEVRHILHYTRLWRVMNSAQWVAWGIVQAKAPGMEEGIAEIAAAESDTRDMHNGRGNGNDDDNGAKIPAVDGDVDEEEEFDYLAYAQDRAMFFWSDMLALGLANEEELPAPMVEHIKSRILEY